LISGSSCFVLTDGHCKAGISHACIHMYMSTKTISIRNDVYKLLKNAKQEGESFTDVIERLLEKKTVDLSDYFGALDNQDILDGFSSTSSEGSQRPESSWTMSWPPRS